MRVGPIESYLADLHRKVLCFTEGEVATYIPELAKADPNWFGIVIATVDGKIYAVGDTETPFTIQSVSKPFLFGLALEDQGRDTVLRHVGVEPTGDAFNSVILDEENNRPFNPMVNAGAIAVSAMVEGRDYKARRGRVLRLLERFAGRRLAIDERVFLSERETGTRNKAIAALMRQAAMLEGDTDEILDLYFSQCSVLVDCRDLALMAATLANGGVHPITRARAIAGEFVPDVLSVMNSCGMYNYAGQWSYEVGAPAKSGVSGAIIAAIPGQVGIAAFSPPLDRMGNSIRGLEVCKRIAKDFDLHVFRHAPNSAAIVRSEAFGDALHSKRKRALPERHALEEQGGRIAVIEAQGALFFGAAERLDRRIGDRLAECDYVIVDMHRVLEADAASQTLLAQRAAQAAPDALLFAHIVPDGPLRSLYTALIAGGAKVFPSRDTALEACEDRLLGQQPAPLGAGSLSLRHIDLFRDLPPEDLRALEGLAQAFAFESGHYILREGDSARKFFVIAQGSASVSLRIAGDAGRSVRVATMGAGATVGELALLDGGPRSADVIADRRTVCYAFAIEELMELGATRPRMLAAIFANLSRDLAERLRSANGEIRSLET